MEWLALAAVHMHVAAGDHGQLPHGGEVAVVIVVVGVMTAEEVSDTDPESVFEPVAELFAALVVFGELL